MNTRNWDVKKRGDLREPPWPKILALGLLMGVVLASAGTAGACTSLQIRSLGQQTWDGSAGSGYEVFESTQLVQAVNFQVRKRGATGCDFFVTAATGSSGSFNRELQSGGALLTYNLYTSSTPANVIQDLSVGSPTVLSGTAPGGNATIELTFYWSADPSQVVDSLTYQDDITVSLYEGTPASSTLHDTDSVRFRTRVDDTTDLSLVNSGGGFDATDIQQNLDFQTLSEGASLGFDLLVRTNTGYDITMSSTNRGVLVMTDPNPDGSRIPYTLRLDSAVVDLGGNTTTISGPTGATTAAGNRHVVEVEIGAIGNASAGNYGDEVTITVSSK